MTYITMSIDIDDALEQVSDEDIREEYHNRNLGGVADNWDEHVELEKAHMLHHQGRKDEAYEILWRMCLIKLNKVV